MREQYENLRERERLETVKDMKVTGVESCTEHCRRKPQWFESVGQ